MIMPLFFELRFASFHLMYNEVPYIAIHYIAMHKLSFQSNVVLRKVSLLSLS